MAMLFSRHQRVLSSLFYLPYRYYVFKPQEGATVNKMLCVQQHCSYLRKWQQIVPDDFFLVNLSAAFQACPKHTVR